jgi:5-methylcytosine-specific restriction endonuclease McrA
MTSVKFIDCDEVYYRYCDECGNVENKQLFWHEKDFTLCFECLMNLAKEHLFATAIAKESIKTKRRTITEDVRNSLMIKANYKCELCFSDKKLEIDHIMPFALGGSTSIDNLRVLCKSCNLKRRQQ